MFKKRGCHSCQEFDQNQKADSPSNLSAIIRKIKQGIAENILVEIDADTLKDSDPFELISIEGPWNDIVLNYFECVSCKNKFKLFANTYQGSSKNGWYKNS